MLGMAGDETTVSHIEHSESFVALMEGIGYVIWIGYKTKSHGNCHIFS